MSWGTKCSKHIADFSSMEDSGTNTEGKTGGCGR